MSDVIAGEVVVVDVFMGGLLGGVGYDRTFYCSICYIIIP